VGAGPRHPDGALGRETPCMSPSGPGKAQGRGEEEEEKEGKEETEEEEGRRRKREGGGGGSHSSIAHSISSMCSKYLQSRKSIPSSTNTFVFFLNSLCLSALAIPRR